MSKFQEILAPLTGSVITIDKLEGSAVAAEQTILVLESMKLSVPIPAPTTGVVKRIMVNVGQTVDKGSVLFTIAAEVSTSTTVVEPPQAAKQDAQALDQSDLLDNHLERHARTLDAARPDAVASRVRRGFQTARQNIDHLIDPGSFLEYGQLAVAAQRQRRELQDLQTSTAADGIITGVASVNGELFADGECQTALIVNDYSVLAGTQGFFHHMKLDRMLKIAGERKLPVIMYTEGGGGRPGDTDITTVNSGLQCSSFGAWAKLSGVVPRIAVANNYNFAGNAALFGAADITIATQQSWIGMAGPAMIAGGGLGDFKPTDIGPIDVQSSNGVVDIVADDEVHAAAIARQCLAIFQGSVSDWQAQEQTMLNQVMPDNRRYTYDVREIIRTIVDQESFIELKTAFGSAIIVGFARLEGRPFGLMASNCQSLGGAIDVDAGEKAADFLDLCNNFGLPILSLCDTPGFMVGPQHEEQGAVRRLAKLFTAGSQLKVNMISVVLRKCYGLGAQAMLGGSSVAASYTVSWPSGEFGAMGLQGAVQLGFKRELDAQTDPAKRQTLFDDLLAQQYQRGQASEVASVLEIDAVIEPSETRRVVAAALF